MSQKLSSIRRRLAKVQQQMAEIARREELSNCNCRDMTDADDQRPEKFEREMNLPCPTHGLRRLGTLICSHSVAVDSWPEVVETGPLGEILPQKDAFPKVDSGELDRLLEVYKARLAEDDRVKREKEDQAEDDEEEDS